MALHYSENKIQVALHNKCQLLSSDPYLVLQFYYSLPYTSLCNNITLPLALLIYHCISAFSALPWVSIFFCNRIDYVAKSVRPTISSYILQILTLTIAKFRGVVNFLPLTYFCSFGNAWRALKRNFSHAKKTRSERASFLTTVLWAMTTLIQRQDWGWNPIQT